MNDPDMRVVFQRELIEEQSLCEKASDWGKLLAPVFGWIIVAALAFVAFSPFVFFAVNNAPAPLFLMLGAFEAVGMFVVYRIMDR